MIRQPTDVVTSWAAMRNEDQRGRHRLKAPELFVVVSAFLTTTCTGSGPARNSPPPPALTRRPNIVMVLVDDMRWDEMRVAGHPFIDTPNMDRLAREGVRFTNAFATTPLCSPSRASFSHRPVPAYQRHHRQHCPTKP